MEALEVPSPIRDYSSERFIFPAMSSNTCVKQTPNGVTGCGNRNSRSHSVLYGSTSLRPDIPALGGEPFWETNTKRDF